MAKTRGTTFNDLQLAGNVRSLGLKMIKEVLEGNDEEYKKALLLKISSSLLPKLNEHTGVDGGAIELSGVEVTVRK